MQDKKKEKEIDNGAKQRTHICKKHNGKRIKYFCKCEEVFCCSACIPSHWHHH